jgi:hypothetical protein
MNFSETHKKWALTATLGMVLSFNLVMSLGGGSGFGAANLASHDSGRYPDVDSDGNPIAREVAGDSSDEDSDSQVTRDVDTKYGTLKVRFKKDGEKTTANILSDCEDCSKKDIPLPIGFTKNISDMKKALIRAQEKSETSEARYTPSKKDEDPDKKDAKAGQKLLAEITKECGKIRAGKHADERLACFSDKLLEVLTDDANEDIEFKKDDVFRLFAKEIAQPLLEIMRLSPDDDRYVNGKDIIAKLASDLPSDYNYLRQSLAKVNAKIVADAERGVKEKLDAYKQLAQAAKTNPAAAPQLLERANALFNEADQDQMRVGQLKNDLGVNLFNGYSEGVSNSLLTSTLADTYMKTDYLGTADSIIKGLQQNALSLKAGNLNASYTVPMIDISTATSFTLADGTTLLIANATANTVTAATQNFPTTANGLIVRPNNLTTQNVINAATPFIAPGQTGQNTAQIMLVNVGQGNSLPQQQFTQPMNGGRPAIRQ